MTGTRLHNVEALEAALAASEARAATAEAKASDAEAQVAALTLMIEKLRRALYGQRSERKERLFNQLELALDELEAGAAEDELVSRSNNSHNLTGFPIRGRSDATVGGDQADG